MRANTKGGVTPRDRRLDRRKVAIAAVAALFLFAATPAMAGLVEFVVVPTYAAPNPAKGILAGDNASYATAGFEIDATELAAGFHIAVPQVLDPDGAGPLFGSDTAHMFGNMDVSLGAGTIAFPNAPGSRTITYELTGAYAPLDPYFSDPPFPPAGITSPANYGLGTGSPLFLAAVYHGLKGFITGPARGTAPVVGTEVSFPLLPGADLLLGTGGRLAYTSALGGDTGDLVGDPLAAFGTAGGALGSWDPSDTSAGPLGTLTIPVESAFALDIDTGDIVPGTFVHVIFKASGQLVATPKVPEPSSLVLLGFGVIGLVACGWRIRKRRA